MIPEFIERDGKPATAKFGDDEPERVRDIMGFESATRLLEIRIGESGRVAMTTTNKLDGKRITDSFTRESFYALYLVVLNVVAKSTGARNLEELDDYKFFDARIK